MRNGWDDVSSAEVGNEMRVPRMEQGDKVRLMLDMDAGDLQFAKCTAEDANWQTIPGLITGIYEPVAAVVCIQDKSDGVVICAESVKCTTYTPPVNEGAKPLHFASPSIGSNQVSHSLLSPGLIYCQLNQRFAMPHTPPKRAVTRRLMTRGL